MNKIIAQCFGWAFIVTLLSAISVYILLPAFIMGATLSGVTFSQKKLLELQQTFYLTGYRRIWQYDTDCSKDDPHLAYKPKHGRCEFSNVEFSTTLSFDDNGRVIPNRALTSNPQNLPAVVILGDSHAMGWGVDDNQQFANVLQSKTLKPVFNLAVSSYATERELDALRNWSKQGSNFDTVIIQYCNNDYGENQQYPIDRSELVSRHARASAKYKPSNIRGLRETGKHIAKKWIKENLTSLSSNKGVQKNHASIAQTLSEKSQMVKILDANRDLLEGKKILVFYSNAYGYEMHGFEGKVISDAGLEINFIDLKLDRMSHFYQIDDHPNALGHSYIATKLAGYLT